MMQQLLQVLPRCLPLGSSGILATSTVLRSHGPGLLLAAQQASDEVNAILPASWALSMTSLRGYAKAKGKESEQGDHPLTGYNKYVKLNYDNKYQELGGQGVATFADVSKKLGEDWKAMSAEAKANYNKDYVAYQAQQKEVKKENAKRYLSSFHLFQNEYFQEIKAQIMKPGDNAFDRNKEVMSEIGARWRALPPEKKEEYSRKAKKIRLGL